jgi:hypothetical protein
MERSHGKSISNGSPLNPPIISSGFTYTCHFLIQSIEDARLGSHREMCLEACRDTLRTYHIMRSDSGSAFNMVKVIDYKAFICSTLLLFGIMGYDSP